MNIDKLDILEEVIGQTVDIDVVMMLSREIIKVARDIALQNTIARIRERNADLEIHELKLLLREALKHWTPSTNDETTALFQMAHAAGVSV